MAVLLDHHGRPISTQPQNKKAAPPRLGESFGNWAGRDDIMTLPGGGILQFNLDNLTLEDFRQMRDNYQINASLSVLTFMMHQLDWSIKIGPGEEKIRELVETQMHNIWGRLVRAMSQAFWAGYSPNVLEWDNDVSGKAVVLNKIKDLRPDECSVNWLEVEGFAPPGKKPPKLKIFDGIIQSSAPYPVPVSNSLWYPLLMENGDYNGKKLLRSAFVPWFFSHLLHLFANRYFERYGEPLPIGRAPYDEEVDVNGTAVRGNLLMEQVIGQIRSRAVVVLPNDKTIGSPTDPDYDYQLEYLESQMRGADFERYMTRLDEEMSLAMFMPLLLLRTGDVGSYSLGEQHTKTWLWVMNALALDWAEYINRYVISPMISYNFSDKAPRAKLEFRRLGKTDAETVRAMLTALVAKGNIKPDVLELGQIAGLTLTEIEEVTGDGDDDDDDDLPVTPAEEDGTQEPGSGSGRESARLHTRASGVAEEILGRVESQVTNAFRKGTFGPGFEASLGYKRRFAEALGAMGYKNVDRKTDEFYLNVERTMEDLSAIGDTFTDPAQVMAAFSTVTRNLVAGIR